MAQHPEQNESTLRHRLPWSTQNESNSELSDVLTEQAPSASSTTSSESSDIQSDIQLDDQSEPPIIGDENSEVNEPPSRVTAQLRLPKYEEGQDDNERREEMSNVTRTSEESSSNTLDDADQRRQLSLQAAERRLQGQQQQ